MSIRCTSKLDKAAPSMSCRSRHSAQIRVYRFGLILLGALWIAFSSTLCGCRSTNGYLMNRSGKRYYDKGNYEFARYEFERALMDAPHNPDYAFNVARTMERQGEYENAELMYQHALTIDPSHQPTYHGLAAMLREQGRVTEASELLTAWAETQPYHPGAQVSAAEMASSQGNQAQANQYYQQAMQAQTWGTQPVQQYAAQPQMFAQNQMLGQSSPAYPYAAPPSVQMANVMPRTDFTMMGGPVVAHQGALPPVQLGQPLPATSMWTPTMPVSTPVSLPTNSVLVPKPYQAQQPTLAPQAFQQPVNGLEETTLSVPQPPSMVEQTSFAVPSAVRVVPAVRAF